MTDAHSVAYHEYSGNSETRIQPKLEPKLRGWRIDPAEKARKLARIRRERHKALLASIDYSEGAPYVPTKDAKARREREKLQKEFSGYMRKWQADTSFLSSIQQKTVHPSYLQIIAMGKDALPLIFEELEKRPGHWFTALHAITGANPVPNTDAGRIKKMAEHWIRWGRAHGYY